MIKTSTIRPYWRNSRNHTKTVPVLVESIKRYGFNQPIVLDTDMVIICGHARYMAVRELRYDEVPCVISGMNKRLAMEYRLADNAIQNLTVWEPENLNLELRALDSLSEITAMFGSLNLDEILPDMKLTEADMVKQGDVTIARNSMMNKSNDFRQDLRLIVCPHCGGGLYLKESVAKMISEHGESREE